MTLKDEPKKLQPYLFHGVQLSYGKTGEAVGDCPFCGRDGSFYVNQENGLYSCKVCAEGNEKGGGNIYVFLQKLWEYCRDLGYRKDQVEELCRDRGLSRATLQRWGMCRSILTDEWLFPGFNENKKVINLYRWATFDGKRRLIGTPGQNHSLFGLNLWKRSNNDVVLCEGPFDAMAYWEALGDVRKNGNKYSLTDDVDNSLRGKTNVLAVPGCETFREQWLPLFLNKNVTLLYDSDHPRDIERPNGTVTHVASAGWAGMERAVGVLKTQKVGTLQVISWGPDGYDPDRPSGFDLRDLRKSHKVKGRYDTLGFLSDITTIAPPSDWGKKTSVNASDAEENDIEPLPCQTYKDMTLSWRKSLKWTEVLDCTLSTMMACAISTNLRGDQLWVRVIGPPGSAKSTLCEALSVSKKYTFPTSVQRGFHSGYKGGGEEDSSLIPKINRKTVIVKDGDTMLNSPNRDQILSELRDIYDGTSRAHYRTGQSNIYSGIRVTFILAGTRSLRRLNRSFLGDRFVDCVIYDRSEGDQGLESEILNRAAFSALRRVREESDGSPEGNYDDKLMESMQLTAGYLEWLRENVVSLMQKLTFSDENVKLCEYLGELVSYLRARPDKEQSDEDDEVELATRLSSQFVRLTACTAVVMGKTEVDREVTDRLVKVAYDTGRGISLAIVKHLYANEAGLDARVLAIDTRKDDQTLRKALKFLYSIGVVRPNIRGNNSGARGRNRHLWELTPRVRKLYKIMIEHRTI